jgi:hypothetical protein
VHHELSDLPGPRGAQAGDQSRESIVRHCQQNQLGPGHDAFDLRNRHAWQQRLGARPRLIAHRRDGHQTVASPLEGGTQDGTDPARADDTDVEPSGSLRS